MLCCFCSHMDTDTMKNGFGYCDIVNCFLSFSSDICGFFEDCRLPLTDFSIDFERRSSDE